ncbi:uncharacterized protein LOC144709616 [Wolffia australiana]
MSKVAADAEMVVRYKDPAYDVVKDICVDCEGLRRDGEIKRLAKGVDFSDELSELGVDYLKGRKSTQEQADSLQSSPGGGRKLSLADLLAEDRELDECRRVQTEIVPAGQSSDSRKSSVNPDYEGVSAQSSSTAINSTKDREEESKPIPVASATSAGPISEEVRDPISENSETSERTGARTESQGTCEIELCPDGLGPAAVHGPPGPSVLSDPVTLYSGHLQFSGSVSLRSESSATSARSFAFPILQSEWCGSPINMARIDRRRLRRRRSWRSGLLCCRF